MSPHGNGVRPLCCGREPTLRVYHPNTIYLCYECTKCGHSGGPSMDKGEAAESWRLRTPGPLTD